MIMVTRYSERIFNPMRYGVLFRMSLWNIEAEKKNNSDQTYSYPRDWRLSASWVGIEALPETHYASHCYRIGVLKEGLQCALIMPRDTSLVDNRCEIFQSE